MRKIQSIVIIFCVFCPLFSSSSADIIMPLEKAVNEKKVEVDIIGLGGSTGDTIQITVQRMVAEVLHLTIEPGTVFLSKSGNVQNMVCSKIRGERAGPSTFRSRSEIVLKDNSKHAYIVEAYCLDFHKANPGPDDQFEISTLDIRTKKILEAAGNKSLNTATVQNAIWIDREGLSDNELKKRFPVSDSEIKAARDLLLQLSNKKKSELNKPFVTELPSVESIIDPSLIKSDITLPSIEPVIDPTLVEPDIQSPSFDPVIDSSVNYYPKINLPQIEPIVELPPVEPVIKPPQIKPDIQLPSNIPVIEKPISHPHVKLPQIGPVIELPSIEPLEKLPSFEPIPELPSFEPIVEMPSFEPIPELPDLKMHEIEVPDLKTYEIEVPDLKVPDLKSP